MKAAIVGSRGLILNTSDISFYLPAAVTEIVSGGAKGVDTLAKNFAIENNYKYIEFLPDYEKYGKAAPLRRNDKIIDYSNLVLALWDGKSKGTKYVIDKCKKIGKSLIVYYHKFSEDINLSEIEDCEYCNLTALSNEMLKEIIIAELDAETDVDTELIKASINAILSTKREPIFDYINKEEFIKCFDKYYEIILRYINITKTVG